MSENEFATNSKTKATKYIINLGDGTVKIKFDKGVAPVMLNLGDLDESRQGLILEGAIDEIETAINKKREDGEISDLSTIDKIKFASEVIDSSPKLTVEADPKELVEEVITK